MVQDSGLPLRTSARLSTIFRSGIRREEDAGHGRRIRSQTLRPGRAGEHPPRAASARPATPARSWARVRNTRSRGTNHIPAMKRAPGVAPRGARRRSRRLPEPERGHSPSTRVRTLPRPPPALSRSPCGPHSPARRPKSYHVWRAKLGPVGLGTSFGGGEPPTPFLRGGPGGRNAPRPDSVRFRGRSHLREERPSFLPFRRR